jgi:glycerol-3-phosphate dehydrogenase
MNRDASLAKLLARTDPWDIVIIGGGATGVGAALDAAARGYAVCLLEMSDLGKGASSRSTKLIHGGVRYLQQGNISLVTEALRERGTLRHNAPHLVHDLAFVVPNYLWWEAPFYGIGMKVYDLLAGQYGFGKSRRLSREEVLARIPTLETNGLRGGVLYYDGQFDDSRLLIDLAQTADAQGAVILNYAKVVELTRDADGLLCGLSFIDLERNTRHAVAARCIVNATGPFSDDIRLLDDPQVRRIIAPSQGVHLVVDRSFLPGDSAIMVPRTSDGRVMFAIPWHDRTLLGTTDTPIHQVTLEPLAQPQEIDFILETSGQYLSRRPTRADVRSVFVGIRPLVMDSDESSSASLSREHTIQISPSGLLSIAGGKWTTYRRMAQDSIDQAAVLAGLDKRPCPTATLPIHGWHLQAEQFGDLRFYGAAAPQIRELIDADPELGRPLHESSPICAAQVIWAVRHEMARTVDDVLARRTRALLLDARAAISMAAPVAALLAAELKRDERWKQDQIAQFTALAGQYVLSPPC